MFGLFFLKGPIVFVRNMAHHGKLNNGKILFVLTAK